MEMIRHIGKYTGKKIIFHPREAVLAYVDAQEIKQVVLNLIVNALESMVASGTLKIDARYNHGMAEMVFTDNGSGMSPAVLRSDTSRSSPSAATAREPGSASRSLIGSSTNITARSWPRVPALCRARLSQCGCPSIPPKSPALAQWV